MKRSLSFFAAIALLSPITFADPRPWTFVEDTYSEGKGNFEYEQYVTFARRTDEDHSFKQLQFKHEFEYGLTDNFDVSLYLATWNYTDSADRTGSQYEETAIEGIYYFSNPVTSVGLALYTELAFGPNGFDVENKLLLQKDIGNWSLAYNLVVETAFENAYHAEAGQHATSEGELAHDFGISYAHGRHWRTGAELTVESAFPRWSEYGDTAVYAGPNASYWTNVGRSSEFWITVTPMFQLSSVDDEPQFQLRMIAGWVF